MQASPNINIDPEHNFDSDAVLLIGECRRVIDGSHSGDPAQRLAHASIAAGQVLKWLKRASPGDLRAIRVKGVKVEDGYYGERVDRMLIVDMFTSVMACYAVKCMEPVNRSGTALFFHNLELRHKVLEMLSKCAELGCVASKLMLARMCFECKNAVKRQLLLQVLEFYGVSPAAALEYLRQAADVHNDCEAHVLLGKLHIQGSDGKHGRPKYLPVKSPVPFNVEKSLDHFEKAIESYDAMAEPKLLLTIQIPEQYLGAFSREQVLKFVCIIGNMYMDMCTCTKCVPCNLPHDPKRSMNIFKWAASKGCLPAVAVLGGAKPKCAHCGDNNPSKHCPGCLCTKYCSKECQRKHWSHHKGECRTVGREAMQTALLI